MTTHWNTFNNDENISQSEPISSLTLAGLHSMPMSTAANNTSVLMMQTKELQYSIFSWQSRRLHCLLDLRTRS